MTDEARRLEALFDYGQLDTAPEPALDELTELAAEVCETPISMISLVDAHRQWFKSKKGVETVETDRKHSFCAHALYQSDILIVPDASADGRFAEYPTVTGDPHIRFYAGAPLLTPDGLALGTLCVIDRVDRHLSEIQKRTLRVLSRQVMARFELRRQTRALLESEALLSKMFRSCPVAVALKSWREEVFLHVNQAFTSLVGWSREEIMGRTVADLGLLDAETVEKGPENVVSVRRRSGETRRVLMDSTVILDAREPQVITTFVDITDLEQAEAALQLSGERIDRLHALGEPLARKIDLR
jgi:PAS domain S-box-containing protein